MIDVKRFKQKLAYFKKTLWAAVRLLFVSKVIGVIVGSIVAGRFSLRFLFHSGFIVSCVIILVGVATIFLPMFVPLWLLQPKKMIDHSTHAMEHMERREVKQAKGYETLYLGMTMFVTVAILQFLLSVIL